MVDFCVAVGCSNNGRRKNRNKVKGHISFHRFPFRNKALLKVWIAKLKRADFTPAKSSSLCSEHFEPGCFVKKIEFPEESAVPAIKQPVKQMRKLKPDSVPTMFAYNLEERMKREAARPHTVARLSEKERKEEIAALLEPVKEKPTTSKVAKKVNRKKIIADKASVQRSVGNPLDSHYNPPVYRERIVRYSRKPVGLASTIINVRKPNVPRLTIPVQPMFPPGPDSEPTPSFGYPLDQSNSLQYAAGLMTQIQRPVGLASTIIKVRKRNVPRLTVLVDPMLPLGPDSQPTPSFGDTLDQSNSLECAAGLTSHRRKPIGLASTIKVIRRDAHGGQASTTIIKVRRRNGPRSTVPMSTMLPSGPDSQPTPPSGYSTTDTSFPATCMFASQQTEEPSSSFTEQATCSAERYMAHTDTALMETMEMADPGVVPIVIQPTYDDVENGLNAEESIEHASSRPPSACNVTLQYETMLENTETEGPVLDVPEHPYIIKQENIGNFTESLHVQPDVRHGQMSSLCHNEEDTEGYLFTDDDIKTEHFVEDNNEQNTSLPEIGSDVAESEPGEKDEEGLLIPLGITRQVAVSDVKSQRQCNIKQENISTITESLEVKPDVHDGFDPQCQLEDDNPGYLCNSELIVKPVYATLEEPWEESQVTGAIENDAPPHSVTLRNPDELLDDSAADTNRNRWEPFQKPFSCTYCDKRFNDKCTLTRHWRIHTGEKPFPCIYCNKPFNDKGNLSRHLRIHTGEKPFSCTYCDKRFNVKCSLTMHLRIHTGEKPFLCTYCKKRFTIKNYLTEHLRTHTGEKPFCCPSCNKRFRNKGHLTTHLRIHTGEKHFISDFMSSGISPST